MRQSASKVRCVQKQIVELVLMNGLIQHGNKDDDTKLAILWHQCEILYVSAQQQHRWLSPDCHVNSVECPRARLELPRPASFRGTERHSALLSNPHIGTYYIYLRLLTRALGQSRLLSSRKTSKWRLKSPGSASATWAESVQRQAPRRRAPPVDMRPGHVQELGGKEQPR